MTVAGGSPALALSTKMGNTDAVLELAAAVLPIESTAASSRAVDEILRRDENDADKHLIAEEETNLLGVLADDASRLRSKKGRGARDWARQKCNISTGQPNPRGKCGRVVWGPWSAAMNRRFLLRRSRFHWVNYRLYTAPVRREIKRVNTVKEVKAVT